MHRSCDGCVEHHPRTNSTPRQDTLAAARTSRAEGMVAHLELPRMQTVAARSGDAPAPSQPRDRRRCHGCIAGRHTSPLPVVGDA